MTINTAADVIQVIKENPRILFEALHEDRNLLNEVRRLVLTEDLLEMPGRLAEVVEVQKRTEKQLAEVVETQKGMLETQKEIIERQDRTEGRQDRTEKQLTEVAETQKGMLERQDRTEKQLAEVIETQKGMLKRQDRTEEQLAEVIETQKGMLKRQDRTEEQLAEVIETQKEMDRHLGRLRGAELERLIVKILPSRLNSAFGLRRPRIMLGQGIVHVQPMTEFFDAVEDSDITESQRVRIENTDMIVMAQRKQTRNPVYIAIEASATIRIGDIDRARMSAEALWAAFGVEAKGVVVGYAIRPEDEERAETHGISVMLLEDSE